MTMIPQTTERYAAVVLISKDEGAEHWAVGDFYTGRVIAWDTPSAEGPAGSDPRTLRDPELVPWVACSQFKGRPGAGGPCAITFPNEMVPRLDPPPRVEITKVRYTQTEAEAKRVMVDMLRREHADGSLYAEAYLLDLGDRERKALEQGTS